MATLYFLYIFLLVVEILSRNLTGGLELGLNFAVEPGATLIGLKGRPLLLNCVPDAASGPAEVAWLKDDVRLANSSHYTTLANGSLLIDKIVHKKGGAGQSDQGVYRCLISNSLGALVSRPTRLRVAGMAPDFSHKPPTLMLGATGDVLLLPCSIESVPTAVISWQRDSKPLPPQPNKLVISASGALYILAADYEDSGNYSCSASNPETGKTKSSPDALLTIVPRSSPLSSAPVEFLDPPLPLLRSPLEGDSLVLECAARGRPAPPTLEWVFVSADDAHPDGALSSSENIQGVPLTTGVVSHPGISLLSLTNVSLGQSGNYTCRSVDETGSQVALGPSYQIEVMRPPRILSRPKSVSHPIAKTVRFQCEVEGVPRPSVLWLKDGKRLVINGRIKQRPREILISNTVSEDAAIYQCIASSPAGEVWGAGRFLINATKAPINAPTGLQCAPLSPRQIRLSWEHAVVSRGGTRPSPQAFTVHFVPTDGGDEKEAVVANRTFIVENLQPYTNYSFYVRAYGGNTVSDQSASVTCLTLESVPVATPTLLFPSLSATWLNVTWSPLPYTTARGDIVQYKIEWRRTEVHNVSYVDLVSGNTTHYVVTGLLPDTSYELRVLARTAQGFPANQLYLSWTPVHTAPDYPHLASTPDLRVKLSANQSAALLEWAEPSEEGEVEAWRVTSERVTGGEGRSLTVDRSVTSYLLEDLEPNTVYRIHLLALLSNGLTSAPRMRYLFTGGRGGGAAPTFATLAPPGGLDSRLVSTTALNLTWAASSDLLVGDGERELDHYTVSLIQRGTEEEQILESDVNWVLVTNLRPYTWYLFKVKVVSSDLEYSEYSYGYEVRTLQGAPSPVRDIAGRPLNQTAVSVWWKAPAQLNGVLSMYLVSFSLDPGLALSTWPFLQVPADITYAEIGNLHPQSTYFLSVRAVTQAGISEPAPPLTLATYVPEAPSHLSPHSPPEPPNHTDQLLGIIVGCSIGACCIALCTGTLLYKRRCAKPPVHGVRRTTAHVVNGGGGGGGLCRVSPHRHAPGETLYEMQYLGKQHGAHDCYPNGGGGVRLPLIPNGRVPNGAPTIVRITENPQFSSSSLHRGGGGGGRQGSGGGGGGEADSLLSGAGGLDESHLTTLLFLETSGDTHLTHLENSSGGGGGEGGDSGFCGGGDDRVLPPLLGSGHFGSPSPTSPPPKQRVPPPSPSPKRSPLPSSPPTPKQRVHSPSPKRLVPSPLSLDSEEDDGFHDELARTRLEAAPRYGARTAGPGVASKC